MVLEREGLIQVGSMSDLRGKGSITVQAQGKPVVLFLYGDTVYAIDNRCPHMGFPLDQGTVHDHILTCHWHHARFDLASGGAFDLWADDVDSFPVDVRDDEIWVDMTPQRDVVAHQQNRLQVGLERNLSLVIAKSVIQLLNNGVDPVEPFSVGLDFGTRNRGFDWGRGLTTHGCTMNLIPYLDDVDKPLALYHGLTDVASDTAGMAPHFGVSPLPNEETDIPTLTRWFRQFVEVRDNEAAERCVISALRAGADDKDIAEMLFSAATDHRYLDAGHTLDFINKALESVDLAGWEYAEFAFRSVVPNLTNARRMEESNAWRNPIDLVAILETAFAKLESIVHDGRGQSHTVDYDAIVPILLADDPQAIVDTLLDQLRRGVSFADLAGVVAYTASRRIAHFHISNEFGDWDTALHTFTFANAVHQGLRRINSLTLLRGVFDSAMSIYLDRFLNVPSTPLPKPKQTVDNPDALLDDFGEMLNLQQQVNQAGMLIATYLDSGGSPDKLMATMGGLLLREDRNFHTIQCVEASFNQYTLLKGTPYANHVLVSAGRYLAAHAPTMRAQGQTYQIALRLSRGDKVFAE